MSKSTNKNHDALISSLPDLETEVLGFTPARPQSFIFDSQRKYWINVKLDQFPGILRTLTHEGHRKRHLSQIIQCVRGKSPRIETHSRVIRLGLDPQKGIRVFYPNLTLKVRYATETEDLSKTWFARECQGRDTWNQKLGERIRIPKILAAGETMGLSYLLEERVKFRSMIPQNSRDRHRMKDKFLPLLMMGYDPVSWHPLSKIFQDEPGHILDQALNSSIMTELDPHQADLFATLTEQFGTYDQDVPFSLCHGDICLSNVGVDEQGQLVLLDWETWGEHPIALEFSRLVRAFGIGGEIHQTIRQQYTQHFQEPTVSLDRQITLYYLLGLAQRILRLSEIQNPKQRALRLQHLPFLGVCRDFVKEMV